MTKKKIFNHHTKDDTAIINMDNKEVMDMTNDIKSSKLYFLVLIKQIAIIRMVLYILIM